MTTITTPELGDPCKDVITGFEGVCAAITECLYGCRRFHVEPPVDAEGKMPDGMVFDQPRVTKIDGPNRMEGRQLRTTNSSVVLGDPCQDLVTGFKGVCIGITYLASGAITVVIEPIVPKPAKTDDIGLFSAERVVKSEGRNVLELAPRLENTPGGDGRGALPPRKSTASR